MQGYDKIKIVALNLSNALSENNQNLNSRWRHKNQPKKWKKEPIEKV